jgi:transcriptional regulator of acetoin/glycerol metabolism
VDVRVVAATHRDLAGRIEDGRFRRDLFARLAGFELTMPPLRDRPEDVGSLIAVLLRRAGVASELTIDSRAGVALLTHGYPMNVRELEQGLRSAVALASGGVLGPEHLPAPMRAAIPPAAAPSPEDDELRAKLIELLRRHQGNVSATARAMDKAPVQIRRWCRRLGIQPAEFRR